jgi:hypothetical protein
MSAPRTQELTIGHLTGLGWRQEKADGLYYLRHEETGRETGRYDYPGTAFREALEIQKGAGATPENLAPEDSPQPAEAQGIEGDSQNGSNNIPKNIPADDPLDVPRPARTSAFWLELAGRIQAELRELPRSVGFAARRSVAERTMHAFEALADAFDRGELPEVLFGLNQKTQVVRLVHNEGPPTDSHSFDTSMREALAGAGIDTPGRYAAARAELLRLVDEWATEQGSGAEAVASFSPSDEVEKDATEGDWHEYFEQTPGEGCFLSCGKPEDDPVHRNPEQAPPDGKCPPNCGHAKLEHEAFDAGLKAGESGWPESSCLITDGYLREAWLVGHSVGASNRSDAAGGDGLDPAPYVPDAPRFFAKDTGVITLNPKVVRTDGGTQARAGLHEPTVTEYVEAMRAGEEFPAVVVFYDGTDYWLADGFHRQAATLYVGRDYIVADVRQGTKRDAVLYAVGANARHGLRRTDADKRRAVETLLRDDVWSKWSNREVARQCGVSKGFVGDVRAELTGARAPEEVTARRGGTEYTVSTANLAGPRTAPAEATPSGASRTSAPETEAAPPPSAPADEAGGAEPHPADASAGAGIKVTDRRIKHDGVGAPAAHVAARPDRLAELKAKLKGRALTVTHTFFSAGVSGVMVTINLTGKDPTEAVNSRLFTPAEVRWLGDVEYELVSQRLDAEKSKPKGATKAAAKKSVAKASAVKSSKKAAAKAPVNVKGKEWDKSPLNPARFKKGSKVAVILKGAETRATVVGVSPEDNRKLRVAVGNKTHDYFVAQLPVSKGGSKKGAAKKPAGRK